MYTFEGTEGAPPWRGFAFWFSSRLGLGNTDGCGQFETEALRDLAKRTNDLASRASTVHRRDQLGALAEEYEAKADEIERTRQGPGRDLVLRPSGVSSRVVFVTSSRRPVDPHRVVPREGAVTGVMIDPVALFERSFEVADAYEKWLETQAELFWALHAYSAASLGLFRSLLGKRPAARAGAPHRRRRKLVRPREHHRLD